MPELKKVLVSLPDKLLEELDEYVSLTECSRTEVIREAMRQFVKERRSAAARDKLRDAYVQMGEINLSLSENFVEADTGQQFTYEKKLAERE